MFGIFDKAKMAAFLLAIVDSGAKGMLLATNHFLDQGTWQRDLRNATILVLWTLAFLNFVFRYGRMLFGAIGWDLLKKPCDFVEKTLRIPRELRLSYYWSPRRMSCTDNGQMVTIEMKTIRTKDWNALLQCVQAMFGVLWMYQIQLAR